MNDPDNEALDTQEEILYNEKIQLRITREPVPRPIKDIYREYFQDNSIILRPEFQRNFVWNSKKQKELIKSLYAGIPLPMFYFAETENGKLEVIDGQQRLTTIFGFINKNSLDKESQRRLFKVINLKENGNIISIAEIKDRVLKSRIYCVDVPKTNLNAKFEIFQVLNQGSLSLKPQEIRNSLFTLYLKDLNHLCKHLGSKIRYITKLKLDRMTAEELALRFILIFKYGYEFDLTTVMNNVEKLRKDFDNKTIREIRNAGNKFIKHLIKLLGKNDLSRVFQVLSKKRKPPVSQKWSQHFFSGTINQGLFHLLSYYLPKYSLNQISRVSANRFKKMFLVLLKNKRFVNVITGSGTNSRKNIHKSKELFEKVFLKRTFGAWTNKEPRSISRNDLKTILTNIPYCYLSYKNLAKVSLGRIAIDHIKAYKSGNKTDLSNLLPALKTLNRLKGAQTLEEFRKTEKSLKSRKRYMKNIDDFLFRLKNWNRTYKLANYRELVRNARFDKRL